MHQRLMALQMGRPCIAEVRGLGLLMAIEFAAPLAEAVISACNEAGLLLNAVRPNAIRFMPPLTITPEEIDEAIGKLDAVLQALAPEAVLG